jgi:hypothetical protein
MIFQSARSGSSGIGSRPFAKAMSRITLDFAAGGTSPCAIARARARMRAISSSPRTFRATV